jgi:hypothetical protein
MPRDPCSLRSQSVLGGPQLHISLLSLTTFLLQALHVAVRVLRGGVASLLALRGNGALLSSAAMMLVLYGQLQASALNGGDLAAPGTTAYMFDAFYISAFVLLLSLVWGRAHYIFAVIPAFLVFKLVAVALPYLRMLRGAGAGGAGGEGEGEPTADEKKRLEKKEKRAERRKMKNFR